MSFLDGIVGALRDRAADPVVLHGRRAVTGGELLAQAGAAQVFLEEAGVRAGDRVVVVAPNSPDWIALDLAIMASGAIAVPLYHRQAPAEIEAMVRDCDPAHAFRAGVEEAFSKAGELEPAPLAASDPVRVFYTSGTSGAAKGAILNAGNVEFMLDRTGGRLDLLMKGCTERERVFHYLPFCFAGSWILLATCLTRGVFLRTCTSLEALGDEMRVHQPHYVLNVPLMLERIKAALSRAPVRWLARLSPALIRRRAFGPDLRALICGSAPLDAETQRFYLDLGVEVLQVYGLTETTAICTMDLPGQPRPGCVGRAIEGCEMRVDEGGGILVRGPNVFPGYWGKEPHEGWLETGDLGAVDEEGNWSILGRRGSLLVLASGHNVAPEPIERALQRALPGAEQVVLHGNGRPALVALVAGKEPRERVDAALAAFNADRPHFERVRAAHIHAAPLTADDGLLTANGKLRRERIADRFARELEALYPR